MQSLRSFFGIQKQPGANTLELTRTLDGVLDDLQKTLPAGMTIDRHIFRQADFIERALDNLEKALRDGGILVVIVVLVFLINMRAAAITLIAIPLSLVAAVLTMNYFGFTSEQHEPGRSGDRHRRTGG